VLLAVRIILCESDTDFDPCANFRSVSSFDGRIISVDTEAPGLFEVSRE
jgi:hypothetical protein